MRSLVAPLASHARWLYGLVIAGMHALSFGLMWLVIEPQHLRVGAESLGLGLALTVYVLGVRHAFDADHIAVIDNTTRKLMGEGTRRPEGVGFWFALGHSSVVAVMTALVALGMHAAASTVSGRRHASEWLALSGALTSGCFLVIIGLLNFVALQGIWRVFTRMRTGELDEGELEHHLNHRGGLARLITPLGRMVKRPIGLFPVGMLLGLGVDTASEVALLVLAGSGAASGLPWYAVMVLPLVFASGMTLCDFADGVLMTRAYHWALTHPVRKVYYNLTVTGLSVVIALLIGGIELIGILHDKLEWNDPVTSYVAGIDLGDMGYLVAGTFAVCWGTAVAYWKIARVEERWANSLVA